MVIHGEKEEELTRSSYKKFYCDSPIYDPECGLGETSRYGTFHQRYYLDGVLIAVGIIDIVKELFLSAYFFYDPYYRFLSPGVVGALTEIQWIKDNLKTNPRLKYYSMDCYAHCCPRVNYKSEYKPCQLLCPVTFQWVPFDSELERKSDQARVCRFAPEDEKEEKDIEPASAKGEEDAAEGEKEKLDIEPVSAAAVDTAKEDNPHLQLSNIQFLSNSEKLIPWNDAMGFVTEYRAKTYAEWIKLAGPEASSSIFIKM